MTRVLVTGATGFVGRHLVAGLVRRGAGVVGASAGGRALGGEARSVRLDVCDRAGVRSLLGDGVDLIFHLAFSRVRPGQMALSALEGTATLLEEAAQVRRPPRILLLSSGAVYGLASGLRPLTEADPVAPATYYAVLKLAQETLAASYVRRGILHVVTVRGFNLVGPGEDGTLVTGALARQIARGERAGSRFAVQVGNLEAHRDFTDVRDVAEGVIAAADAGGPGEVFNVCTGRATQVRALVDMLRGMARVPFELAPQARAERGADIPYQVGSAARLRERTGWSPVLSLEESLRDLLDDARGRVDADAA